MHFIAQTFIHAASNPKLIWKLIRSNACVLCVFMYTYVYTSNEQFRKGIQGLYKKQKRQNWDHKAYRDAM